MNFSKSLIDWYLQNKRDLPWRKTTNPYNIWLSEIMLQQTRVAQGLPYYEAFISSFPTVFDLANASENEVLKLWQGLGYYSRARNLHATAKYIAYELDGVFPETYSLLLQLKGVGEYTAAAIASIAYGEEVPVVDGNVFRVLSRYFGIEDDISQPKSKKVFRDLSNELLPKGKASLYNQALMEFGALQCVPKSPNCSQCVFNVSCFALQHNRVGGLPLKLKKTKVVNRYLSYLVQRDCNGDFMIQKREGRGIWQNLFEFPFLEFDASKRDEEVVKCITKQFSPKMLTLMNENTIVHKLSHQHLHINFYELTFDKVILGALPLDEVLKRPFPIVIHNFIESNYVSYKEI
ncbi:A/G-specific adenine glycosylase [Flavobacterium chuncheonense]|uniref:Adenine DNA glycosylase n=1 Tax=Flavobacterium chuncheonense TaxID=2026653 RepID=A0ABW5YLM4_9FLAO